MKVSQFVWQPNLHSTAMIILFVFYAFFRLGNVSQSVQRPRSMADTQAYVRISKEPLLSMDFLAAARPFGFPLILKLFQWNEKAVVWAQGILSIFSWGILALCTARRRAFAAGVFGGVLLLSLYHKIVGWDATLMTESLALSLTALFLAAWLWLAEGWRSYKIVVLVVIAFFWSFTRDTNAWVLLMIAAAVLSLILMRKLEKKYLILVVNFMAIFLLGSRSAEIGERWVFPFNNIMAGRILVNEAAVGFFADCGMPVTPALMQRAGGFAGSDERAFYIAPELEGYRGWLKEKGKLCYVSWLLSNPLRSVSQPLSEAEALLTLEQIDSFFFSRRFSPILPIRLESILYPQRWALTLLLVIYLAVFLILFSGIWKRNSAWLVCIVLCLLVLPHYFLAWHGDTVGIYRHVLLAGIQFQLGMWLMVILLWDVVMRSLVPDTL